MIKKVAVFIVLLFNIFIINGQNGFLSDTLKWHKPVTEKITDDLVFLYMYFEGADIQKTNGFLMPMYVQYIPITDAHVLPELSFSSSTFIPMTKEELNFTDPYSIKEQIEIQTDIVYTKKQAFLQIKFSPFKKKGTAYEKLLYFTIQAKSMPLKEGKVHKAKTYATSSILSHGNFYKIAISKTGIHKITYADFESVGISVDNLKISDIALFGNGGKMLPENSLDFTYDDLSEVPLLIIDADKDGIFDADDYVLFYGIGVITWDAASTLFNHNINIYSDLAYYFINVDKNIGLKKRVSAISESTMPKTHEVSSFNYYEVYEKDAISPNELSRIWFSEVYDAVITHSYSLTIPELVNGEKAILRFSVAAKSPSAYSRFTATVNKANTYTMNIAPHSEGLQHTSTYSYTQTGNAVNIDMTFTKPTNNAVGWLDYIEIHGKCKLQAFGNQIAFRNTEFVGPGNVCEYVFDTKGNNVSVWEVTNPHDVSKINARVSGNTLRFKLTADTLREFIAFYGSNFYSVTPIGKIANQNLHGYTTADFVIVTHPDFVDYANQLSNFRKTNDGMICMVVTTTQIYNEFSSGAQDLAAIRNFLKMLYDRNAVTYPKNVLLFGKTSYDFRNKTGLNSNFIPNYQGKEPFRKDDCLSTDDFLVKLDDGEGYNNTGSMDMGLGRFTVSTKNQAQIVVKKSMDYASRKNLASSHTNAVSNLADWRNSITVSADDDADQNHFGNAESIANFVFNTFPIINVDKIYLDAFKKISTSQGQRYPDATNAMNQRINKGTLIFTYMGHGGDNGWANERFLKRTDIASWENKFNQALFYAGSCSFGVYDKTNSQSPSEDILLKSDGGGIGVISATRNSYGSTNEFFGKVLHQYAFEKVGNAHRTIGQIFSEAKNMSGSVNMYVLMGDPSLTLAYPINKVVTDSINTSSISSKTDTIQALQFVTIKGRVTNAANQTMNDFNGYVYPAIYDKPSTITTLLNNSNSVEKKFLLQKNILFKGKASVKNGLFEFSFLVPKDINYDYGFGKISYYAFNNVTDANGYDSIFIGGK
ncbi:MAG: type IX secretion system sortase PorU, partial [Bacteroidales bacterium]|nr:type IX secretion system sortase PorU [Bacteroidales bacterium]